MELFYRSMTYDRHPNMAPGRPFRQVREPGAAYFLYYRGETYRIDPNTKPGEPARPAVYKAIYRGVTFNRSIDNPRYNRYQSCDRSHNSDSVKLSDSKILIPEGRCFEISS
ncbi:MAG: hypothetical protein N4J56_007017 [Chroococcidiopsis sp. SAG 2025]|uniref:DUF4278 domain-containing protein n=1 Tax=Chroococcidiopsis sp. SAG 2025 TaxID=171389 RepID=UPI002936E83C|nr:DUF4278 domain-containing protein [Chroococcidiopsis sp. SAG 2025]MDV2997312.1 hypothetical protein [Chroococcidiopsis sp. SAG 2025]